MCVTVLGSYFLSPRKKRCGGICNEGLDQGVIGDLQVSSSYHIKMEEEEDEGRKREDKRGVGLFVVTIDLYGKSFYCCFFCLYKVKK